MATGERVSGVPCGRRLRPGEQAALRLDTIYCTTCVDLLPTLAGTEVLRFELERGVVCGGGAPLD